MYQETRDQFPKEITKTREEMRRHFSQLSHLSRSFCSEAETRKTSHPAQPFTQRPRDLGEHEEEGTDLCWLSFLEMLGK